jgi:hypothetical protein
MSDTIDGTNHPIDRWNFPDATTRQAAGNYKAADIGKIAFQTDNDSYWRLDSVAGGLPTWVPLTTGGLPTGGTTGQRLQKNSATNYDASWITPNFPGGTAGQTLIKNSATDYDASWLSGPGTNFVAKQIGQGTSTSTAGVMMGSGVGAGGWRLTPRRSGLVLLIASGSMANNVAGAISITGFRWGTGTAPAYQAGPTGNAAGGTIAFHSATANQSGDLSTSALVGGLAIGTDYWFDLILLVGGTGGTVTINSPLLYAVEL